MKIQITLTIFKHLKLYIKSNSNVNLAGQKFKYANNDNKTLAYIL